MGHQDHQSQFNWSFPKYDPSPTRANAASDTFMRQLNRPLLCSALFSHNGHLGSQWSKKTTHPQTVELDRCGSFWRHLFYIFHQPTSPPAHQPTSPPAHQLSTIAFLKASPQPSKSNESPVQVSVVVSCHISFLSPARRPLVHWVKIPPAIWSTNSPLTNSVVDDDDVIFWENCHNNYRDCPVAQVWSNCLVTGWGPEPAWRNSPFARQWSGPIHGRLASNKLAMMVMTMMMMIIIWANMWFPNHTTSANLPFSPHLSDNWSTCGVCFLGITS